MYGQRYEVGQVITYAVLGQEYVGKIKKIYPSGMIDMDGLHSITFVKHITGIVSDVSGKVSYTEPVEIETVVAPKNWLLRAKEKEVVYQNHIESVVSSVTESESNELFATLENFNKSNWRDYWVDVALSNKDEEMFKKYA